MPSSSTSSVVAVVTTQTVAAPIVVAPSSSSVNPAVVTVTSTVSPSTTTAIVFANSASTDQGTMSCSTGFHTCAASLGGGCCPTDRACGTGGVCPPLTTTTVTDASGAVAPVRPTGDSSAVSAASVTTAGPSVCPTGYYMCSAYYIPGCCQVGRNCDTTDCPSSTTQTVVSNGETIIVPGGAGGAVTTSAASNDVNAQAASTTTAAPSSSKLVQGQAVCATGWSACGSDQGGGCCPSEYACGASCTLTAGGGPGTVAKAQPQSQAVHVGAGMGLLLAMVAGPMGVGMVML